MTSWQFLADVLVLLATALVLGTCAERIRQSAILGYLVAGTLVGPNVLAIVGQEAEVRAFAELGVALLLFAIGLEFSFQRLRRLGRVAVIGGSLQILATLAAAASAARWYGLDTRAALAVGAMVALSSTAAVLRLLADRAELDSVHGRHAVGVLLLQDLAVIPLMLMVELLGGGGTALAAAGVLGRTVLLSGLLVAVFLVLSLYVVPRVLNQQSWARSRELPILLAVVLALGSAYAAHTASLSPAMGAFVAGVLLGESSFATQIRADIASLRTLLVTLFFTSIGMLGNPTWVLDHWATVSIAVVLVTVGKSAIVWPILRMLGSTPGVAMASALCLGQIGEFSFVLAEISRGPTPLIDEDIFNLIVSTTIVTLFLTPFLVAAAPRVAERIESARGRRRRVGSGTTETAAGGRLARDIVIVGFGPAGQAVAHALYDRFRERIVVIELSPASAGRARQLGLSVQTGDALHIEVLEHAGVRQARVIAITIPDPGAVAAIVQTCRHLAPRASIVARARYHLRRGDIESAGASDVIDEEAGVGGGIATSVRRHLGEFDGDATNHDARASYASPK